MSPGQESPVPEEQELHQPSRGKEARKEVEQDPGGRGCPGLPGTLTGTYAPGECAELPKGCSAHGGTGAARRASGGGRGSTPRELCGRERDSSSAGPGAQGAGGHSPTFGAPLGTGRGQKDTGQQGRPWHQAAPNCADPCSLPPEQPGLCGLGAVVVTAGADSKVESWQPPLFLFLLVSPCTWD